MDTGFGKRRTLEEVIEKLSGQRPELTGQDLLSLAEEIFDVQEASYKSRERYTPELQSSSQTANKSSTTDSLPLVLPSLLEQYALAETFLALCRENDAGGSYGHFIGGAILAFLGGMSFYSGLYALNTDYGLPQLMFGTSLITAAFYLIVVGFKRERSLAAVREKADEARIIFEFNSPQEKLAYDKRCLVLSKFTQLPWLEYITSENQVSVDGLRRNSNAGSAYESAIAVMERWKPESVACNMAVYQLSMPNDARQSHVYFLPSFIIVSGLSKYAILDYEQLNISAKLVTTILDALPEGVKQVDRTWAYTCLDGTPDLRFKDNYERIVVNLGKIALQSNEFDLKLLVANLAVAHEFVDAFRSRLDDRELEGAE